MLPELPAELESLKPSPGSQGTSSPESQRMKKDWQDWQDYMEFRWLCRKASLPAILRLVQAYAPAPEDYPKVRAWIEHGIQKDWQLLGEIQSQRYSDVLSLRDGDYTRLLAGGALHASTRDKPDVEDRAGISGDKWGDADGGGVS